MREIHFYISDSTTELGDHPPSVYQRLSGGGVDAKVDLSRFREGRNIETQVLFFMFLVF